MPFASLSIDLDEIPCYHAIHGLPAPAPEAAHRVYDIAVARALELAEELGLALTLFVVTRDLDRAENKAELKRAAALGHELASHSHDHCYDLTRLPANERRRQLRVARDRLETLIGHAPRGFRAPGYLVTNALFDELADLGFSYDSSVFPCPAYYGAKAGAIGWHRLRGRRSKSLVDDPRMLLSPTQPYRLGRPYWRRGTGLVELPIQVTRGPRLPFIGTTLTLLGPQAARGLTRLVVGEPLVNLELHGIDFLAAGDAPELTELAQLQADLRVPWKRKRRVLVAVVEALAAAGHEWVTLATAAEALGS